MAEPDEVDMDLAIEPPIMEDDTGRVIITRELIAYWADSLHTKPTKEACHSLINALKCSIDVISGNETSDGRFILKENGIFNQLFTLCLNDLLGSVHKILNLAPTAKEEDSKLSLARDFDPSSSKKWKGLKGAMKVYLTCLLKLMDNTSDKKITLAILNHILNCIHFFILFTPLMKKLLRQATNFWGEAGNEEKRILAFFIILRILSRGAEKNSQLHSYIMRKLYLSYVRVGKSTNHTTWSGILFMRQSLIELYSLDHGVAYQQCFVFMRQMAILLRNAIGNKSISKGQSQKSSPAMKSVYSWSFVHSLHLWQQLLSSCHKSDVLEPLIYPLVQIILGTIKLYPSPRHHPLHVHLVRLLIRISSSTGKFIPILPLIIKLLDDVDYKKLSKKQQKGNTKHVEVDFRFILRVPADTVHHDSYHAELFRVSLGLLTEYLASQANKIGFVELIQIPSMKLKKIMKNCQHPQSSKELKRVIELADKTREIIAKERKKVRFAISNVPVVDEWEKSLLLDPKVCLPILTFYQEWKKNEDELYGKRDKNAQAKREKKQKSGTVQSLDEMVQSSGSEDEEERPESDEMDSNFEDGDTEMEERKESTVKKVKANSHEPANGNKNKRVHKRPSQNLRKRLKLEKLESAQLSKVVPALKLDISSDEGE